MVDPLSDLITGWKIPIGQGAKAISDSIIALMGTLLRAVSGGLGAFLDFIVNILLWVPPVVLAALIAALAWRLQKSKVLAFGVFLGLVFILNQGMWKQTVATLVLVGAAATVSMLIGLPIGIWAAHKPKVYRVVQPILDFMQTMPTFVYLIPIMALFGLGAAPGLIVTIIFVIPTAVRMTHLGMISIPTAIIEAGQAFGATQRQLLWKVELPAALPTIMAGLTQCIMLSLSMVVIAALIGANGLGKPVVRALNTVNIPLGLEAGLAIVILAIILDRMSRVSTGGPQ